MGEMRLDCALGHRQAAGDLGVGLAERCAGEHVGLARREPPGHRAALDHLRDVPAAVRFVSAEPLLGPLGEVNLKGIDWVIAGGESGPGARVMEIGWGRELRDQCNAAGVKFFFKQWGGRTPKAGGRELDGRTWDDMPVTTAV